MDSVSTTIIPLSPDTQELGTRIPEIRRVRGIVIISLIGIKVDYNIYREKVTSVSAVVSEIRSLTIVVDRLGGNVGVVFLF